jgi:hypothetical protein
MGSYQVPKLHPVYWYNTEIPHLQMISIRWTPSCYRTSQTLQGSNQGCHREKALTCILKTLSILKKRGLKRSFQNFQRPLPHCLVPFQNVLIPSHKVPTSKSKRASEHGLSASFELIFLFNFVMEHKWRSSIRRFSQIWR